MVVGLRLTPGALADAMCDALAPLRSRDDVSDLPVSFSIEVAETPDRLHRLQWGRCTVLRTPDARRLVEGVLRHLQVAAMPPDGAIRLRLASVVAPEGVVLLPDGARRDLAVLGRRLADRGVYATDSAVIDVDLATGDAQIAGAVEVDRVELDAVATNMPRRRDDHAASPGRHRVSAVFTDPWATGAFERLTWLRAHVVGAHRLGIEQLRLLEAGLPLVHTWIDGASDIEQLLRTNR